MLHLSFRVIAGHQETTVTFNDSACTINVTTPADQSSNYSIASGRWENRNNHEHGCIQ